MSDFTRLPLPVSLTGMGSSPFFLCVPFLWHPKYQRQGKIEVTCPRVHGPGTSANSKSTTKVQKKKKNQEISTEVSKTVSTLSSKASHVMSNLPSYLPLPTCESSQTKEVFHLHCVLKQLLLCSDCPHSPPQPQTFRLPPSHPRVVCDLHYEACPRH